MRYALAIFAVLCVATAAHAQTTTHCTTFGNNTTCITDDPHEYDYLRNAGKADAERAGQAIGNLLNQWASSQRTANAKRIMDAVVTTKCGKYYTSIITYSDETTNLTELGSTVSADDDTSSKIKRLGFRIYDLGCDQY